MDLIDKSIIKALADGEKTLPELVRETTGIKTVTYEYRKAYDKIKYRLLQMAAEKFVEKNKHGFKLVDFDRGTATILMTVDDGKVIKLDTGDTIFINLEHGTTPVFLEEIPLGKKSFS